MREASKPCPVALWITLAAVLAACPAVAQLSIDGLPAGGVPSGVLLDRTLPLSQIHELDGSTQSPSISARRWYQAWHEVRRASLGSVEAPTALELRERWSAQTGSVVPVALLDYEYERIRPGVVAGLAEASPVILEVADLESGQLFAAAAMRQRTWHGEVVHFALDTYLTNRADGPVRMTLDADDGRGPRSWTGGEPLRVRYMEPGVRRPRLQAEYADGTRREASFEFEVMALLAPAPDDTLRLTASVPYLGGVASGDAWIYLADGHSDLVQPVVLVEGFDLDNSLNWDEIYALLNAENLLEDIRAEGYDLVVLNFDDATDYIQRNSLLLVELLQEIQGRIDPRAHYSVAGASMGALCSRYALSYMEQNSIEHRVATWISFDGPHSGANIPLGLQYWLDFFSGQSADAEFLLSRLDRPAARQLLLSHYTDPPSGTASADPLRGQFGLDLAALGDYPVQPRRVAIANGSGASEDQGYAPGAQLIEWEHSDFFVDLTGNVWAVADGPATRIFEGKIDIILLPANTLDVTVSGTDPLDNAPGGSRNSLAQAGSTEAPYGDILALHPDHCFIPTISALDLSVADLFFDVAGELDPVAMSPFDAVYFPLVNEGHVEVTAQNAEWIKQEILQTPTATPPSLAQLRPVTLHPNRPNPFNPSTLIAFELAAAAQVRVEIFDVRGQRVRVLLDEARDAGRWELRWDGTDAHGRHVGSGVYYCLLQSGDQSVARRMALVK